MPVDTSSFGNLPELSLSLGVKAFLVLFLVFYSVFALILFRQIQLMAKKLPTPLTPILKFVGVLHVGVSLAVLLLVIGIF